MKDKNFHKIVQNIIVVISILSAIIAVIAGWQAKTYCRYYKEEKLLNIKGNIESYKINTLNDPELRIKLKEYTCTFYFEIDDRKVDWDELEKTSGDNKDCEIKILAEDRKRLQNMSVDIQQLKIGEKEYIRWQDIRSYYHTSVYMCVIVVVLCSAICIFFIYLATGKRYEKLTW